MKAFSIRWLTGRWSKALFGLIVLLALAGPVLAAPDDALPTHSSPYQSQRICAFAPEQAFAAGPIFANWLSSLMSKFESWLNNRTHMIQFCALAMVVGLLIIWWRKT